MYWMMLNVPKLIVYINDVCCALSVGCDMLIWLKYPYLVSISILWFPQVSMADRCKVK